MATAKDAQIFVCGVTQYAMSSGKFSAEEIETLAQNAYAAFIGVFGDLEKEAVYAAPAAPQARPPSNVDWQGAAAALSSGSGGMAGGKPFALWSNDTIKLGKKPSPLGKFWGEVTWGELLQLIKSGNGQAQSYAKWITTLQTKDEKYARHDQEKRERAQAVLDLAGSGKAPQEPEQTPF